jgi:hypothetical protein
MDKKQKKRELHAVLAVRGLHGRDARVTTLGLGWLGHPVRDGAS